MKEQVVVIAAADQEFLGHVRCIAGLRVAVRADQIWIRGILDDGNVDLRIRQLPAIHRYILSDNDQLFPQNGHTPIAYLPRMDWTSMLQFLPLELPTAAFSGQSSERIGIRLVPSSQVQNPVLLRCNLIDLQSWVGSAPEIRIKCLKMVADRVQTVLVMGHPLPNIPGTSFWSCEGLLLPAGFVLEFPVLAPIVLSKCNPEGDALVMIHTDGSWQRIPLALFVAASRSGIRQTPLETT